MQALCGLMMTLPPVTKHPLNCCTLNAVQCRQVQFAQRGLCLTVLRECQAFIINVLHVEVFLDLL